MPIAAFAPVINIIIPTASRPLMLRTALQSIANQTAVSAIDQIIVSENCGDRESEAVCREFPSLPITYIFRTPPTSAMEHGNILIRDHLQSELTVFLHADDWWTPDFLQKAIAALSDYPRSVAFCCCSYYVIGETCLLYCGESVDFWFGADYPPIQPIWEIEQHGVLLATLLSAPVQYSTMVVRTDALRKAAVVHDLANWYDSDRMLTFELSRLGTIAYSPLPHSFYRMHGNMQTRSFAVDRRDNQMASTTQWLIERDGETWESAGDLFSARLKRCPPEAASRVWAEAMEPWSLPHMARNAPPSSNIVQLYHSDLRRHSHTKKIVKSMVPPALWQGAKYLRKKAATK